MKSWYENKIALAYDEKFQVLELARKDYKEFVDTVIGGLHRSLMTKNGSDINVKMPSVEGENFAKDYLQIKKSEWPEELGLRVVCRLSAPWGGEPGYLQLGVLACLDSSDEMNPKSMGTIQSEFSIDNPELASEDVVGSPMDAEVLPKEWVWGEGIPLGQPALLQVATKRVRELLRASEHYLKHNGEPWRYVVILDRIKQNLNANKPKGYEREIWVGSNWHGQRFVQMNGQPNYWVGFHVKKRQFMYGHEPSNTCHNLPQVFAEDMKVKPIMHGNRPAGILFSREDMDQMSDDELVKKLVDSFYRFSECVRQCKKQG